MTESTDARRGGAKSEAAFRTISEVASDLDVPQHVLRFWETKFTQIRPMKRGGGRRYYRPEDVLLLRRIRALLYDDGLTIKGVQKLLREKGVKALMADEPPLPATLEKVEAAAEARQALAAESAVETAPPSTGMEPEGFEETDSEDATQPVAPPPPRLTPEDRRELEMALAELEGLRDELQAELRRQEAA